MSRTEKPSPHSSPRQIRKILNSNSLASSSSSSVLPSSAGVSTATTTVAAQLPTSQDVYSSCSSSSSGSVVYSSSSAAGKTLQNSNSRPLANTNTQSTTTSPPLPPPLPLHHHRMSAPVSSVAVTKALNQRTSMNTDVSAASFDSGITSPVSSQSLLLHFSEGCSDLAPPLPPRKGAPVLSNVRPQEAANSNVVMRASRNPALKSAVPLPLENVCNEFEVPRTTAPPVPKHQSSHPLDSLVQEFKQRANVVEGGSPTNTSSNDDLETVIVGPAETISGLIDTRPLEARKPIILKHPVPSPTDSLGLMDIKESVLFDRSGNNLYQLKTTTAAAAAQQISQHARHQSLTMPNTSTSVPKSVTTPLFHSGGSGVDDVEETDLLSRIVDSREQGKQPLLYENVSINNKDCNVSYENINLEYIARLVSEGYSKENAITALGISRNNIEMACDILHEFVSKSSV